MKHLRFTFTTSMEYSVPVAWHQLALRCVPMCDNVQTLTHCEVTLSAGVLSAPQTDGFGSTVYYGSVNAPHTALCYGSTGTATVDLANAAAPPPNPALKFAGARTRTGPTLVQVSSAMARGGTYEAAQALNHAVHGLLEYRPGVTGMRTTAEQALAGGYGVCQDYAQVFVALARLAGWSARYCMGLTVGEGATHAWAEIYWNGAWHGFDPTRDCPADERYLRFAVGRDAADCPVEQGTFWGLADQRQTVFMRVEEISASIN